MATFQIEVHEQQKLVHARLDNDTIRAESGALHYWRGHITMESKAPDAAGFLKSAVTGENVFRPTYTGTGDVYIGPPYFGEFAILELEEGHSGWILDRGAYLCSDGGVEVTVHRNTAMNALLGGEGLFQTLVKGRGVVVMKAPGTIRAIDLQGETIAVDGRFAVAREATLQYEVKRASASLLGSVTSGEGLLQYISGHGRVLLAPVPDLQQSMIDKISAGSLASNDNIPTGVGAGPLQMIMGLILFGMVVFGMCAFGLLAVLVG